ncbi:MAG: hypothetical protein ACFFDT_13300 [Candidatus Hodarchaeota archaeon]
MKTKIIVGVVLTILIFSPFNQTIRIQIGEAESAIIYVDDDGTAIITLTYTFQAKSSAKHSLIANYTFDGYIDDDTGECYLKMQYRIIGEPDPWGDKTYSPDYQEWDNDPVDHEYVDPSDRIYLVKNTWYTLEIKVKAYCEGFFPFGDPSYVDFYHDARDISFEQATLTPVSYS